MITKFSLYDFIAVVVPGVFFLWALGTFGAVAELHVAVPLSGGPAETSVLVVVGYVTGLLLHGVGQQITERVLLWYWGGFPSARWLLPEDRRLTARYRAELGSALLTKFGINLEAESLARVTQKEMLKRNQEIFYRCYRFVETLSDLPQTFNAQYGLFRVLLTTFLALALVGGWQVVIKACQAGVFDREAAGSMIFCVAAGVVCYWRVNKRADDFAKAVYDVFLASAGGSKA